MSRWFTGHCRMTGVVLCGVLQWKYTYLFMQIVLEVGRAGLPGSLAPGIVAVFRRSICVVFTVVCLFRQKEYVPANDWVWLFFGVDRDIYEHIAHDQHARRADNKYILLIVSDRKNCPTDLFVLHFNL